jgi:hypothetical protein
VISLQCHAQKNLNENPVFRGFAQRNIEYPPEAIRYSLYGRIYATFVVDTIGRIDSVKILYPAMSPKYEKNIGFGHWIKQGLQKTPLLGLGYKGEYMVPIAFVYTNYDRHPLIAYPNNRLPVSFDINNLVLLDEIQICGKSDLYPAMRRFSRQAPFSKQIDE